MHLFCRGAYRNIINSLCVHDILFLSAYIGHLQIGTGYCTQILYMAARQESLNKLNDMLYLQNT